MLKKKIIPNNLNSKTFNYRLQNLNFLITILIDVKSSLNILTPFCDN